MRVGDEVNGERAERGEGRDESRVLRCAWATTPLLIEYHDREWGVPLHDDASLFELLSLEGAQAGLSWVTVLRKRARYRALFRGFDPAAVARITPARVERILQDPGIIRNRAKVESTIANAKAIVKIAEEIGSFDAYVWRFVGGKPIVNRRRRQTDVPSSSPQSVAMSRDLLRRGFRFTGPTICYAFMQAAGLVNDHLVTCVRRDYVGSKAPE
ncbi:MAG: DNA-3-methyladenine glycosylase I [Candidatus Eremiobacteraeota bacterium]|nr:DNA-3-methyladenine glycosylase I [Candidatus Eremiobacteraeota bacterium]